MLNATEEVKETMSEQESQTIPLTVVVITKNEEDHIGECLASVKGWAGEIVLVDDGSTDRTCEIASEYTDKIFKKKMVIEGSHRNWAYAQSTNEWVLSLDADEEVTDELKVEIAEAIKSDKCQAYSMPIRTYIGDYWVKYSGWYPASKIRMFMKSRLKYEEVEVHPRPILDGLEGRLTKDIIHKGYPDFAHFLASLNRQTTLEAKKWLQTNRKMSTGHMAWRTFDRFPRIFFRKKGYKDGFVGFMIAFFASLYQIMSLAKYWEMTKMEEAVKKQKEELAQEK